LRNALLGFARESKRAIYAKVRASDSATLGIRLTNGDLTLQQQSDPTEQIIREKTIQSNRREWSSTVGRGISKNRRTSTVPQLERNKPMPKCSCPSRMQEEG
jgi:hypothetical protein